MPGFNSASHLALGLRAEEAEEVRDRQTDREQMRDILIDRGLNDTASGADLWSVESPPPSASTSSTTTTSKPPTNPNSPHQNNIFKNDNTLMKGKSPPRKTKSQMKATQNYMYRKSNTVPESLLDFVAEIHEQDRITPDQEIELGEKTQAYMELQAVQSNLAKELGRTPTDDEWCAAAGKINLVNLRKTIEEGLEAKNKLVTSNLRLVQRVVNVYIRNGLSSQYNAGDLMQEGTIALIRAAEKFQPSKGFRFSTYAMFWIRASVKRSQLSQSREISVPQRVQEVYKKMQLTKKELEDKGLRPSIDDIAEVMGVKMEVLEKAERAMSQKTYSLDCGITNKKKAGMSDASGGGSTITSNLYKFVESKFDLNDPQSNGLEREMIKEDIVKDLRRHLDTERAEMVILRYGLEDVAGYSREPDGTVKVGRGDGLSIKELAGMKGMKQDKVRRIIKTSLVKLKPHMKEWLKEV